MANAKVIQPKLCVWAGAIGTGALALFPSKLLAAPMLQDAAAGASEGVWPVLLPLSAAAIGVERATEIIWNYVEWALLNFRRTQPADLKTPQYIQFKSGTSLVLGVVLGILVSNYTGMRLFDYLKPLTPRFLDTVPPLWDVIITGIIIGSGAKPAHEILGMLTHIKNFFSYAAINQRENAGAALAQGVLRLAESENKMMLDVPGMGPAHLPSMASTRGVEGADAEEGDEAPVLSEAERTQQYVDILRRATAR
ncbi:MAG: hypothetical protein R3A44_01310 [Caldilineaceae bacterium]